MVTALWRGPGGLALRHCVTTTALPTLLATGIAAIGHSVTRPQLDGGAPGAATPWLALPLLVAAVGCCLRAASMWPTFTARQPGADAVRRLDRGPLGGRGAVIIGALLAQLLLTVPLTTVLASYLGAPAMARRYVTAEPPGNPLLAGDHTGPGLRFELPANTVAEVIWLRPIAGRPIGSLQPTAVQLTSAGELLATTPIEFSAQEPVRVAITTRSLTQLELTRTTGNVPLLFARGSVIAVGPANLPSWLNGLLAALFAASTSLIALLIGALLGLTAGWPTVATLIGCAHFVQWVAGVGPVDESLLALLRGHWLLGSG